MNRIYKVIWSKVRHCYVVVSELVGLDRKSVTTRSRVGKKMAASLAVMALCVGMTSGVMAADISFFSVNPEGSLVTSNENNEGATGTHAMAIGIDASATGTEGVAIGKGAVSAGATSISMGKKSNASGSSSIAIGQSAASSASNAIALGSSTEASYNYTVALGHSAKATALQGVAIGPYAKAEKDSSVAIGYFAKATDGASNGVSIGRSASVTKSGGVALGYISVADRSSGVTGYNPMTQSAPAATNAAIAQAWGFTDEYNALNSQLSDTSLTTAQRNEINGKIYKLISPYKSGYGAVSVGTESSTRQIINVAAGTEDSDAVNLAQLKALANKVDSDKVQYFSVKSTITANQDNSGATGTDTIAIGPNAKARYTGGIAIGKDASAAAGSMAALAIGYETSATGVASTAIGVRSKATGSSVTAVGFDSVIKTASSGSGRTGDYSVAMGVSSLVDGGKSAIAIGNNAYAIDTTQATVVGTGAMVSALPENSGDSIVITDGSEGTKTITKDDEGEYTVESTKDLAASLKERNGEAYGATALGSRATAHNLGAVAVGLYSTAIGDTSVAVGNNSMTLKDSAVAVGSGTIASAEDALSLGGYANASKDTAVALGAYAKTDRDAGELFGYVPGLTGDELTKFQTDNADSVIWNSNRGAVSVGIKGKETRQITNVAAGTEDTDAVNIAQLKAIGSKVDANKISYFSVNSTTEANKDNDGATGVESIAIGGSAKAKHYQSIAIGGFTEAANIDSIAIGYLASATEMADNGVSIGRETRNTVPNGIALGSYSVADRRENILSYDPLTETNFNFTPEMQTALDAWNAAAAVYYQNPTPENAQAAKDAGMKYRSMVAPWMAGMGALSLGNGEENLTRQITNVAAGTIDTDAVNIAQLKAAKVEVLAGTNISSIDKDTSAGYTQYTVNAKDTITDSASLNGDTITFTRNDGTTYKVSGLASTSALETNKTKYFSVNSSLDGNKNNDGATGINAIAAGGNSTATGNYSTALGSKTSASAERAVAIGYLANSSGMSAVALGNRTKATGATGIAIGSTAESAFDGIALGATAKALTSSSMALGTDAEATGFRATAFSNFANAAGEEAMAFGYKSQAKGNFSTAIGSYAWTNGKYSLAFGDQAFVGKMTKEEDSDLVNDPSVPSVRLLDWYSEEKLMTPLTENEYANSMALGKDAKGYGFQTTAIGSGAEAYDTNTLAVGFSSNAKGHFSNAIGGGAQTNGKYATAVGFKANAGAESALALGDNANATISNGVALGSASKTNVDAGILGYDPSGKITSQDELLGNNKATYDSLQNDISTAKDTITSLANEIVALQNDLNTADSEQASSINSDIRSKERALKRARAALVEKESEANKLVATWQATGAAISVGNSETGLTRQITNVAAGTLDTDAVNVAQLKQLSEKVAQDAKDSALTAGKNIRIDFITDENTGVKTNTINLEDKITLGDNTDVAKQVTIDGNVATVTAGTGENQVVVNGSAGQVTIGAEGSQLVIGKQADTAKDKEGNVINPDKTGNYITGLDNTTWNPAEKGIVENRAATEGQLRDAVNSISTEIGDINTDIEAIQNAKRDFISDTGEKIEVSNAETLSIKGGAAANSLTEGNIGVVNDGTKGFKVKLSSKLSGLDSVSAKTVAASDSITVGSGDTTTVISGDSVTTGNTTVNTKGLTVAGSDDSTTITVQSDNVSMGGNKIQNVAAGKDITDAVNVGQLNEAVTTIGSGMNHLGNQINKLDNRVDRVGAGAAALAALHPLEYDPNTRWEVSAGVGNYRGANAVAVGAFYRPNYDTMVSIGSSYGGGENMVNAGVTWRIGEGGSGNYQSKGAMAQEINDLRSVVDEQNSKLASQSSQIESQSEQLSAQSNEIKAQRQQLEEQNKKIEQLMQAIEDLKK